MHPYFTAVADFILAGRAYERCRQRMSSANNALDTCQRQANATYPAQTPQQQQRREASCALVQAALRERLSVYSLARKQRQAAYQVAENAHQVEQAEILSAGLVA